MSAEEEQTQDGYEDGAAGGPGAPMPLNTLEVSTADATHDEDSRIARDLPGSRREMCS